MRACASKQARVGAAVSPAAEASTATLVRRPAAPAAETDALADRRDALAVVKQALRLPGQPLHAPERAYFEGRFGHDFGRVRVHADGRAAASARAVNALAYTVGHDIVFAPDQYRPATARGRRLIAHELAHVIQQDGEREARRQDLTVEPSDSADERRALSAAASVVGGAARPAIAPRGLPVGSRLMRADPDAVGQVRKLGTVVGAGIQFWPTNVVDTQIGPVAAQPGLLGARVSRLNVIIGENLTPRLLARELLPLWTTATPFTPSGGGAPVPPGALSEEQLAQGLLVYNQTYLVLPAMTNWRAGLRLPLPVDIDEATGIATLNADVIRSLAGTFDPTWAPALDHRATSGAAPPAATVQADVAAFLARETTALARGMHLGARAVTNAQVALPFIRETFAQLGPASLDVALAMMDELVDRDIGLLAAQRDGAAILAVVRPVLAAAPAAVSAAQQASLARANALLAGVAGVAAAAPPGAVPTRAERVVSVDTVRLAGSAFNPATQVAVANAIYAQCNVRFTHGVEATATAAQSVGWLGADNALRVTPSCGTVAAEESALYRGARAAFGLGARIQAFFVPSMTGYAASGYSLPLFCATGAAAPFRNVAVVENSGDTSTLAHEIGHILLNSGAHPDNTIMEARPRPNEITNPQCTTIYNNA